MSLHVIEILVMEESDVAQATRQALSMSRDIGFSKSQAHYIATATAELAANMLIHAGGGRIELKALQDPKGIEVRAIDQGPGISDIELALSEGYSTVGGLGCGLPGTQRLMDSMTINTQLAVGTTIITRKWLEHTIRCHPPRVQTTVAKRTNSADYNGSCFHAVTQPVIPPRKSECCT